MAAPTANSRSMLAGFRLNQEHSTSQYYANVRLQSLPLNAERYLEPQILIHLEPGKEKDGTQHLVIADSTSSQGVSDMGRLQPLT
jgi:hypothetical protein